MAILSIDPGNRYSGVVIYDPEKSALLYNNTFDDENELLISFVRSLAPPFAAYDVSRVIVEGIKTYGMAVGDDVFATCMWIGELRRVCKDMRLPFQLVYRKTYVTHLTGSPRAKDSNVRAALIERWGYEDVAIGGKRCKKCHGKGVVGRAKCPTCGKNKNKTCCGEEPVKDTCPECDGTTWEFPPGPLYGVVSHSWPALAMAVYVSEVPE